MILLFFLLSLIAGAMLAINSANGEKEGLDSDESDPHIFSTVTVGNLFDDPKTRDQRTGASFENIKKFLQQQPTPQADADELPEIDSELQSEDPMEDTLATGPDSEDAQIEGQLDDEEHEVVSIPLSPKENRLFTVYKWLEGLDIAICMAFFICLVGLYFYIDYVAVPTSSGSRRNPRDAPGTKESLSAETPPESNRNFSFLRSIKASIKNYSLQLNIKEPWDFEQRHKNKLLYWNPKFHQTPDRAAAKHLKQAKAFEDLLEHFCSPDDFADFFWANLKIRVKSVRFCFDFKGALAKLSAAAMCLKKREQFKAQLAHTRGTLASSSSQSDRLDELKDSIDRTAEQILANIRSAKRSLGVERVERIDFDDLRGLKVIKIFVSFYSQRDKSRVAAFFERVCVLER